jgi:hypothetical protein
VLEPLRDVLDKLNVNHNEGVDELIYQDSLFRTSDTIKSDDVIATNNNYNKLFRNVKDTLDKIK